MLHDPINNESGSEEGHFMAVDAHDSALFASKEKLLSAMQTRKADILKESVGVFQAVIDKTLSVTKLNHADIDKTSVPELLHKAEYLLNDHRSPIISGLLQTERYAASLPEDMLDFYEEQGLNPMKDPLDIDMYERDNEKLNELAEEMDKLKALLNEGNNKMKTALKNLLDEKEGKRNTIT